MDRFKRYKALQRLWIGARRALASILGPQQLDRRLRHQVDLRTQFLVRQTLDGVIRGSGDPDSAVKPQRDVQREAAFAGTQRQRQAAQYGLDQQRQQAQPRRGR